MQPMNEVRNLLDRCGQLIDEAPSRVRSEKTTALVALAFCDALYSSLDGMQRHAVSVARLFWDHGEAEEFNVVLSEMAAIVDAEQTARVEAGKAARNRLIWTALNRNTKFDEYVCEYVVLLALDAGLEVRSVADALAVYVPGLKASK